MNRKLFFAWMLLVAAVFAKDIDIAVIGGGVNGVYTGTKLQERGSLQVELFEATDRIGGRLYTIFFPEMEHIPVELGGMRFSDDHHRVRKLAEELGLTVTPFIEGPTDNFYYLRGIRLRKHELTDPAKLPYKLSKEEEGKTADQILQMAVSKLIPGYGTWSKSDWEEKKATLKYKGKFFKDLSWINFLSSVLSPEAFQFLADVGDFSLLSDVSVLSQLNLLIPKGGSSSVFKVKEGYQSIPLKLAEKFQKFGGKIHLRHRLLRIERSADEGGSSIYRLIFDNESQEQIEVLAQKVILTMSPTSLLKLLDETPFLNTASYRKQIESVTPNVLTKLFLAYSYPWWRKLNLKEGNSTTSIPIRGCYYFPSEADEPKAKPGNKRALLLASYQGAFSPLWRSLNSSSYLESPSPMNVGSRAIEQAQNELQILHGVDIPQPIASAFQDWGKPPYYAAFYFWNVGADPKEIDREVRKPLNDEEIYVFTSDFCEHQGWVECALEASDQLLERYFP